MKNSTVEDLPILAFKDEIMASESQYVIIEAETGSGKSTMVPQWFHDLGLRVLVTEPLIETVIGTSEYVAELMGVPFGTTVGYRTGQSRQDSAETQILFCTDGLALVRELSHHNRFDILIIDELHEWNTNQSTLEAWAWKHLQSGDSPFQKIVVLSATLDSAGLSAKRGNAPIFKVPGRQFSIIDRLAAQSIETDVVKLVGEGYDVLVFQPGEREILETISKLAGLNAELIPFYGKLDRSEKNRAYQSYSRPKVVVSTNALETGRTLLPSPGRKLAVVDSGMERRIELRDGIEILLLAPIAKARGKQRRGRTGRVDEGIYVDHCPSSDRPDYPVPEILRTRLDQTVLRLAMAGYDATELPFFHDLDTQVIADAKRALRALGAFAEDNSVTKMGKLMAKMPISVQYARMIIEAEARGVVDDVITIAAILEVGGLRDRSQNWRSLTQEKDSDLIAELDFWQAAHGRRGDQLREMGIFSQAFYKAKDLRSKLRDALRQHTINFSSTGSREDILKSCIAGMVDHLFHSKGYGEYQNGGSSSRQKAKETVVTDNPDWIVGLPKDISGMGKRNRPFTIHLVSMVTKVDPMWLTEVAPQLVRLETGLSPSFDVEKDSVVSTTRIFFNNQKIKEETVLDPTHASAPLVFAHAVSNDRVHIPEVLANNKTIRETMITINIRSGGEVSDNASDIIQKFYVDLCQSKRIVSRELMQTEQNILLSLDAVVSLEMREQVLRNNPETITIGGQEFTVSHSKNYSAFYAKVILDSEFVNSLDSVSSLPSGRKLVIVCTYEGRTFEVIDLEDLKKRIEDRRIEKAWEAARAREEKTSWIKEPEQVFPHLDFVLTYVEVTKNAEGQAIYGFVSLFSDSDPDFQIRLRGSKEEAQRETMIGLQRLIKKALKDEFSVPQEEPFQTKSSSWGSWSLTELGQALKFQLDALVTNVSDLTPQNVIERIAEIKKQAEVVKRQICGSFFEEKAAAEKALADAKTEVEAAQAKLYVHYDSHYHNEELARELRSDLYSRRFSYMPSALDELKAWAVETNALNARVEAGLAKIEARNADDTRAEAAGEILRNFSAPHRRAGMTHNGDGWVIRPDGSLREYDSSDARRHKTDGTRTWNRVGQEELALRWSCGHMGDVAGNSTFEVVKRPVGEITPEQLEAVAKIEQELEAPIGSFGLNPQADQQYTERLAVIRRTAQKIVSDAPDFTYLEISGVNGVVIGDDFSQWINEAEPFNSGCENRPAQVLQTIPTADGVLELLAYHKFGHFNFNIRWRQIEVPATQESVIIEIPEQKTDESAVDIMALLKNKFKGIK